MNQLIENLEEDSKLIEDFNEEINNIDETTDSNVTSKPSTSEDSDSDVNTTLESEETKEIELEDANISNCLALTIQEEHKLVAVKNVFLHTLKVTWKVVLSAITLQILKWLL